MQSDNDNIPTLTDIIEIGDASMKNHFDASIFDHPADEVIDEEPEQISDELKETILNLVDEAVKETLPTIEEEFKRKLSAQIIDKLSKN